MRTITELYLNGQLVDLGEDGGIYFNYKQKDVSNPTVVKNSFSKTLTIPGTDNNNNIFNNIWNLTRVQTTDLTTYFNQSKRVGFELFINGELIEQGYCKLNSIKRDGNIEYNISLYGGLGDFFYNLAYNSDTGEKRTLADLDFGEDLTFTINKETIKDAWDNLKAGSASTISFAPAYNGVPDVLDADKVLVNTHNYSGGTKTNRNGVWSDGVGFPTSESGYTTISGYAFAELPKPITEWKMRDVRSYLQRPVLSVPRLFDAISNPDNNGGYEVELDGDFFTSGNSYYKDAWITLPMITELDVNKETESGEISVSVNSYSGDTKGVGCVDFDISGTTGNTNTLSVKFKMYSGLRSDHIYTSAYNITDRNDNSLGGIGIQMMGVDENGNEVGVGDLYWLTTDFYNGTYLTFENAISAPKTNPFSFYNKVITSIGQFDHITAGEYVWNSDLEFKLTSLVNINKFRFKVIYIQRVYQDNLFGGFLWPEKNMHNVSSGGKVMAVAPPVVLGASTEFSSDINTYSNVTINQETILSSEYSPVDYLLSYCKLFNLYFDKDVTKKKVKILTGKNFYNGELDLTYDIDRNIEINPLSFEHKWYSFKFKENNTDTLNNYKAKYGVDFGSQRVNTGYEFDAETEELLKDNIFVNAAEVLEADKYYQKTLDDSAIFLLNDVTYKLYNGSDSTLDLQVGLAQSAQLQPINQYSNQTIKYDGFDKVQLHSQEKPVDGKNVLLFYNGVKNTTTNYFITDDLSLMQQMNENPCWLYTADEYDAESNKIAIRTNELPQFSRYKSDENHIYSSWDFGRTRELFIPELSYVDGDATIYERYWKAYINDLYDVDTRIVTAYIKFDEKPTKESLKHFYFFENSYWVIDEIIDYNPTSYDLTKVRFVKVNDKDNYLNQNIVPPAPSPDFLTITPSVYQIGWSADTIEYKTNTNQDAVHITAYYSGNTLVDTTYTNIGGGEVTHTINNIPENTTDFYRTIVIEGYLVDNPSVTASTQVVQLNRNLDVAISAPSPIPSTATSLSYTVMATDTVKVKISSSALPSDITYTHNSGTTTYQFNIPQNTHNYVEYYGLLAWLQDNPSVSAYTSVEQLGYSGATLTGITLDNVAWVTDVPASGGTASYQNCSYTVTAHYSDNTTQDITNQAIMSGSTSINVPATTASTRENIGVINVIAVYYDGPNPFSATQALYAYQAAYAPTPTQAYVTYNAAGQLDQAEVGVSITIESYSGGTDTDSFTMNGVTESEDGDIDVNLNPTAGTTNLRFIVSITGFTGYTDGQLTIRVAYTDYDSDYQAAGTGTAIDFYKDYQSAAILYVDLIFTPSNRRAKAEEKTDKVEDETEEDKEVD